MRLFPFEADLPDYIRLSMELYQLVRATTFQLQRIAPERREETIQLAMFLIHMQAKLLNYHNFDRFVYAQAAILLGGKLIDQINLTQSIVIEFRTCLRKLRKREGIDNQQKIKSEVRRVEEAEINLMINLGFDLNLSCGMSHLYLWEKMMSKELGFYQRAAVRISQLYQTPLCVYIDPQILAVTGLFMEVQSTNMPPELCGWNSELLAIYKSKKNEIDNAYKEYTNRINQIT